MRPITAADLMNPEVLTVPEDLSVRELAGFLLDNEITGAPVVDREGRLVGVVSVVDIADAAAGEEEDDDEAPEAAGSASSPGAFHAAGFGEELSPEALEALGPFDDPAGEMRVGEIMNPEFYSVREDAAVSEVATTMLNNHVHRLLVIEEGKVAGIITTSDLLGLLVDET